MFQFFPERQLIDECTYVLFSFAKIYRDEFVKNGHCDNCQTVFSFHALEMLSLWLPFIFHIVESFTPTK